MTLFSFRWRKLQDSIFICVRARTVMEPEEVLAQLENWPSDDEEHEDTSSSGLSDDESDMLPSSEEEMLDNEQDGDLNSPSSQSSDE